MKHVTAHLSIKIPFQKRDILCVFANLQNKVIDWIF